MNILKSTIATTRQSWISQNMGLRVMRAFLGVTWIYAGWDKASDAGFLTRGSATFIGTQLSAYSSNSPIAQLIKPLLEHSVQVGIFVMVSEFAIGIATLLWIAPKLAALGGFLMSVMLWLSSSFYVTPYFFASDLAYAILWLSYLLSLRAKAGKIQVALDRRGFIRVAIVGAGALLSTLLGKALQEERGESSTSSAASSGRGENPLKIIKTSELGVGQVHNFSARNGAPAVLFRTKAGVFAYSAICTHEGCTLSFSSGSKELQCPCHGATFDPFAAGKVLSGPTSTPLSKISVKVSGQWIVES